MRAHIDKTRAQLGSLESLASRTESAERGILKAATERLTEVQRLIARAHPGVEGADDAAQQRYLDLIKERGNLQLVIARSKAALPS